MPKMWLRPAVYLGLLIAVILGCACQTAIAVPYFVKGATAIDVSWPTSNCHASPDLIRPTAIVGVNGGLDFKPNKCLSFEANRISNLALYANTGYPGYSYGLKFQSYPLKCSAKNQACLAYNYGYNAGVYTIKYAASLDIHSPVWWLDVETDNSWTNNPELNRASISGEAQAIKALTVVSEVGIYSYPAQWAVITNNWRNNWPNWVATGELNRQIAINWCKGQNFTGGSTWLTQYTLTLDQDYVCQTH